jgi:hypothetical protein
MWRFTSRDIYIMWRIILLAGLGLVLGSRARSERGVVIVSLLFGLLYGGIELMVIASVEGWPPPGQAIIVLGLGLVLAAPVYAIAELWRRTRTRARGWLRHLKRR